MIPLKLHIKNFLSYGADIQTIDFRPHHLICLSGKNGHGKSALLDAITWAIWGQARKVTGTGKADQGLLRLGQTHMSVIFDFELSGQQYRIKREYSIQYGKPYAVLDFGTVDHKTDKFIPLTDKTIRTTQEKIEKIVRLDFLAFCNSAFLRQGQANEFSTKSSKERKEVLASILGLDQFDLMRKRALEKVKEAHLQKQTMLAFQEKLAADIAQKPALLEQLNQIELKQKTVQADEHDLAKTQLALEAKKSALAKLQQKQEQLTFTTQQYHAQRADHVATLLDTSNQWRKTQRTQRHLGDKATLEKEKKLLEQNITKQQQLQTHSLELKERCLREKEQYQIAHSRAYTIHQEEKHRIMLAHEQQKQISSQLSDQIHKAEKERGLVIKEISERSSLIEQYTKSIASLDHQTIELLKKQFEKRKEHYQHYASVGNMLRTQLANLAQRDNLMQEENPSCPLCEQNLSATRRKFLKNKCSKEKSSLQHKLDRFTRLIPRLKHILVEQHKELEAYAKKIEEHQQLRAQIQTEEQTVIALQKKQQEYVQHIQAFTQNVQEVELKKAELAKQLEACVFKEPNDLVTLNQQIQKIERELKATAYDPSVMHTLQQRLADVHNQLIAHQEYHTTASAQMQRMNDVSTLCNTVRDIDKKIALYKKEHDENAQKIAAASITEEQAAVKQQHQDLTKRKEQFLQEQASCQAYLNAIAKREQELHERERDLKQLQSITEDYQLIATAAGKDGIQALLIEEAIPEIEQEANELLARLTDNQMQLYIESLRDLKKGGSKETLDIKISDPSGIRPYEMFSGGEAFRIDFALRIAISKLLARRAGTALQTLIIDEGFGSQDDDGLAHIMDALHKIQDDFAKVIIVSHLPSLKEQFPVQFMVEKQPFGSHVRIIQNG